VFAHRGELEDAEELALEAVAFAATTDFLDSHADALLVLAEVHTQAGRREDAVASIGEAIRLYEQKGNVLSAERARSRLAQT
jgi:tetratricopeptide (TPR) repeat protein